MALPGFAQLNNLDRRTALSSLQGLARGNLGIPILLLMLLAMIVLPIPAILLDVFFTFNIALSLVVLLAAVYALRPLDFAAFPTILLVATLLRLGLNVASTRVVLLEGHQGGDAAGKVIEAFGNVVIGGNFAVGLVVFIILMIINFVVVTKGAGRISEVSARFTLDAMPGKQMAIDADLNAGLIDQDQARTRRTEVAAEADFYGAMDGASKFVRGDAIAGIMIMFINVFGGFAIGMLQHDLEAGDAFQKYTILTIGDGLVAQIPGLLLSVAAAILVTRVNSSEDMGKQVVGQMFSSPKALAIAAAILIIMGAVPGMPHLAFVGLGLVCVALAYYIHWRKQQPAVVEDKNFIPAGARAPGDPSPGAGAQLAPQRAAPALPPGTPETPELGWDDVQPVDVIGLEVGYRLIPMVDKNQGGELLGRIKGVRKKLSQEMGFLVPSVHIRDNLDLNPTGYRISLMGVAMAEADVYPDRELAINPGQVFGTLDGIKTKDPAFGLDAVWINNNLKEQAQTLGYTVVDPSTVVATHLNQILQQHIHELLGHEDVQKLLDMLAKSSPKLAEELVPNTITLNMLLKVLQNLLRERVPIRDLRSIAEALAGNTSRSQDPAALTALARVSLSRQIVQNLIGNEPSLPVITLEPALEQLLLGSVQQAQKAGADDSAFIEPGLAERLQQSLVSAAQKQEMAGKPLILLVAAPLRMMLARFVRHSVPDMRVLAYTEVPDNKQISVDASVGANR
ncbi:flagellar biosynthesis protein FlhA [Cellvibrio japonicus]|uniref:Flagellar biosynthesis protein FlhA n=1 Tax=Cellvibrio japonicus (strain Ueda107) TaxID=498211 RepID=B3PIK4_CELJU|nr:flagellar biosynthesis protein FlhA [Cellvibrio japonicus]ACE82658.1 flagellar biosynthesis protein FlhA [Cellvibrio japonicus Ueda107]QEI12599.1 flagellar biosynthesis protein FlhA [Cellvibrio japonicus]QEI16173.1 flagellar biosynthesis protein FlhA [Cellvibrio japonicus]QEI19751.1 flagellar biosynthesis protein FlhA [Cellvibrio japonicus]